MIFWHLVHSYLSLKPAILTLASWGQVSWVTVLYAKTNLPTIPMTVAVTSLLRIHSFIIWTNLWSTKSIHNIFTLILDLRKVSSCDFHSNFTQSYPTIMTNIFIRWIFTATWASTGIIIHLHIHRLDYLSSSLVNVFFQIQFDFTLVYYWNNFSWKRYGIDTTMTCDYN